MNNLQVFFETRIRNTGFLAALGNFFLSPLQMLFIPSEEIVIKKDNSIARVGAFVFDVGYNDHSAQCSKQDQSLQPTHIALGDAFGGFIILIYAVLSIPGTFLGVFFKALSYIHSSVRASHHLVKEKLTPKDVSFDSKEEEIDNADLRRRLHAHLMTGQATETLIISGKGEIHQDCLSEIMLINTRKLVLNGATVNVGALSGSEMSPWSRRGDPEFIPCDDFKGDYWDMTALHPSSTSPFKPTNTIVPTVDAAKKYKYRPGFFSSRQHVLLVVAPERHCNVSR